MTSFTLIIFRFAVAASVGSCTAVGRGFDRRSVKPLAYPYSEGSVVGKFIGPKVHNCIYDLSFS